MSKPFLYSIVSIGIVFALISMIYGVFMPWSRARSYIGAVNSLRDVKSVQDYEKKFKPALDHPSPIGDEEIPKFLSGDILNIISQNQQEDVRRELIRFIEPYMQGNNVRHLLAIGQMYAIIWQSNKNEADYNRAEEYFLKAKEIGPKLPPVFQALFGLYQAKGDTAKLKAVAEDYLKYWPEDIRVRALLD